MRVMITDWLGQSAEISTRDPELAGRWFAEHAARLMTATSGECRLCIWPETELELKLVGRLEVLMTQDGLLELASRILQASSELAGIEAARQARSNGGR